MHLGGESPQSHKICLFEVFAKDAVANYPEYFRNEQWCKMPERENIPVVSVVAVAFVS